MKLQQDQVWQQGFLYYRIIRLERLEVEYRTLKELEHRKGKNQCVTKKEFCRLIKNAKLVSGHPEPAKAKPTSSPARKSPSAPDPAA